MREKRVLSGIITLSLVFLIIALMQISSLFSYSDEKIIKDISKKYLYINLVELKKKSDYFNATVDLFSNYKINSWKMKKELSSYCEIFMKDFLKEIKTVKELTDLFVRNHENAQLINFSKGNMSRILCLRKR